ncbi:receptor activity-modifying protein 1 precursor [Silurus asotus]|uniref:Receptor activity-modifying protein 1 n=1 Tax=Silurus asotus TaxID=30991 RepID=A0AAD5FQK5_SILAS|nr:receptor activity-modifying protein 1 precursor [Silurus asotus]
MLSRLLMLLLDLAFISVAVINSTKIHNTTHHLELKEGFMNSAENLHYSNCDENLFMYFGNVYCLKDFEKVMSGLAQENWCDWEMVLGYYNTLTQCLEICATHTHCYYPNAQVQAMFVDVHMRYFSSCSSKDDPLPDAPARVVLVLTLLPVSVIPVLVYMVIWKSSVID